MDSREPDSKIVRLRRNGDPTDEERHQLARTIFAEQDEVGTFSRGNLVPPKPATPTPDDEPSAADPFFEEVQRTRRHHDAPPAATASEADATAAYFERLGSQTPAEMIETGAPLAAAAAMPGSAKLRDDINAAPAIPPLLAAEHPYSSLRRRAVRRRTTHRARMHRATSGSAVLATVHVASVGKSPVFPAHDGGFWGQDDWRNWRRRTWQGEPQRERRDRKNPNPARPGAAPKGTRPRDLRSSYVTLRVYEGIPLTQIAREVGTSVRMIELHYAGVIANWDGKQVPAERSIRAARENGERKVDGKAQRQ